MSEKNTTEQRAIDDAQVRATAWNVETDLEAISYYAENLREKMEILDKELKLADPTKDQLFEKFMYTLMKLVFPLQRLGELKIMAKTMQEFGLPHAAEVREIIKSQQSAVDRQRSNTNFVSLIPKVSATGGSACGGQKHLTKEMVHA